nr:hypothetical protein Iba_chr02aCG17220 [Ipomoea batatas]
MGTHNPATMYVQLRLSKATAEIEIEAFQRTPHSRKKALSSAVNHMNGFISLYYAPFQTPPAGWQSGSFLQMDRKRCVTRLHRSSRGGPAKEHETTLDDFWCGCGEALRRGMVVEGEKFLKPGGELEALRWAWSSFHSSRERGSGRPWTLAFPIWRPCLHIGMVPNFEAVGWRPETECAKYPLSSQTHLSSSSREALAETVTWAFFGLMCCDGKARLYLGTSTFPLAGSGNKLFPGVYPVTPHLGQGQPSSFALLAESGWQGNGV